MSFVDSHCHLTMEDLAAELSGVLDRAAAARVSRFVVPGIDLQSSRAAVALAEKHREIGACVGVHPHNTSNWTGEEMEPLRQLARSPNVVAIGEIGLDFYRDYAPRLDQFKAFEHQLSMAQDLDLPVVIHNRQATEEILQVLIEWAERLGGPLEGRAGVLHAFSGDVSNAEAAISKGFYLGIGGSLTYPDSGRLRELVQALPSDRLLLETDAPFLPPQPVRGERNEPSYLVYTAEKLADLREQSLEEIARVTSNNAQTLFHWPNGS